MLSWSLQTVQERVHWQYVHVDVHTSTEQDGQCRLTHVEWRWVQRDPKLMGLGIVFVLVLAFTSRPMWINEYPRYVAAGEWKLTSRPMWINEYPRYVAVEEWKPPQTVSVAGLPKASAGNITTNSQNNTEYNMQHTSIILCCLHCNPSEAQHSLYVPPGLTFSNSTFCPYSVFMCFVWIWEQTAIISIYSINWLVYNRDLMCLLRGTDWVFIYNSTFCPHTVFMCFVWIWQQTAIISLYSINWLVFITKTYCVYCAVRTWSLYHSVWPNKL